MLGFCLATSSQVNIFVSPLGDDLAAGTESLPVKTIPRAMELVRSAKTKGNENINVFLRGGDYFIDKTIVFGPEDGGSDGRAVTWSAYPGETPVLNGGVIIGNWKTARVNGVKAWTASLPEVAEGKWNITQLFVNDTRAPLARYPKSGFFRVLDPLIPTDREVNPHAYQGNEFISAPGDIQSWKGLNGGTVVILHFWIEERLPLQSFDPALGLVTTGKMTQKVLLEAHPAHTPGNAKYYVENFVGALTDPGEWYLDQQSGTLWYIPKPGESPANTLVYAPWTVSIFKISGDAAGEKYVENLHFSGLAFRNTAVDAGAHERASIHGPSKPDAGVISMQSARNCSLGECEFIHLGEAPVIINQPCRDIQIVGNIFEDMAAAGIVVFGRRTDECPGSGVRSILISDNSFHAGGRIFYGSSAIILIEVTEATVRHNLICDYYWSGINLQGSNQGHSILLEKNHIFNIGQGYLSDMGGIYANGRIPGIEIRYNKIHDIECAVYGANCIYLDDRSYHAIAEFNLCYNTNTDLIDVKGSESIIRNNILAFGKGGCIRRASVLTEGGRFVANVEKNILVTTGNPIYRTGYFMDINAPIWNSDLNLIWDYEQNELVCEQQVPSPGKLRITMEEWKKIRGNDRHSVIADPLFRDAENLDFTLDPGSPAFELGFESFDLSDVGPRSPEVWRSILRASESKHPGQPA